MQHRYIVHKGEAVPLGETNVSCPLFCVLSYVQQSCGESSPFVQKLLETCVFFVQKLRVLSFVQRLSLVESLSFVQRLSLPALCTEAMITLSISDKNSYVNCESNHQHLHTSSIASAG